MNEYKKVFITGGSRGIGAAAVRSFTEKGYKVFFTYNSSKEQAERLAAETGAAALWCDITKADGLIACRAAIGDDIDILVNNAGTALSKPFDACTEKELMHLYSVNLFGTTSACRLFAPDMIRRKSGVIVNIASVWGTYGASCEVDYSASKGAVIAFTKALSRELGLSGIRVNCVCPGFIDTDMNRKLDTEQRAAFFSSLALNRAGTPEEVAKAILFLATEESSYITGVCLAVDGGY